MTSLHQHNPAPTSQADSTHMFELCNIRPRHIDQWAIALHNSTRDERLHAEMVGLGSYALQVPLGEDQRPEIVVDDLE